MSIDQLKKRRLLAVLAVSLPTLIIGAMYFIVTIFAGPAPMIHFVVIWTSWLALSAKLLTKHRLLLTPFVALLIFFIPVPNYWRDIARLDFSNAPQDIIFAFGLVSNSEIDKPALLIENLLSYAVCLGLTYVASDAMYKLVPRRLAH